MKTRAQRRADRRRLTSRWLRRIRAKWNKRRFTRNVHAMDEQELQLEAVRRTESHRDIRSHPRKTCSYCNPLFKRLAEERELDRDFRVELTWLNLNLHDLLRPNP